MVTVPKTTAVGTILAAVAALVLVVIGVGAVVLEVVSASTAPSDRPDPLAGGLTILGVIAIVTGIVLALPLVRVRRGSNAARIVATVLWLCIVVFGSRYGLQTMESWVYALSHGWNPGGVLLFFVPGVLLPVVGAAVIVLLWVGPGVRAHFRRLRDV